MVFGQLRMLATPQLYLVVVVAQGVLRERRDRWFGAVQGWMGRAVVVGMAMILRGVGFGFGMGSVVD